MYVESTDEIRSAMDNGSFSVRQFIAMPMSGEMEDTLAAIGADYAGQCIVDAMSRRGLSGSDVSEFIMRYALMRCCENGDYLKFDSFCNEAAGHYNVAYC